MLNKRLCLYCAKPFIPKSNKQKFCSRKHFRKWYRKNNKVLKHPLFHCPKCKTVTDLGFHPYQNIAKWKNFECPTCGYSFYNDDDPYRLMGCTIRVPQSKHVLVLG